MVCAIDLDVTAVTVWFLPIFDIKDPFGVSFVYVVGGIVFILPLNELGANQYRYINLTGHIFVEFLHGVPSKLCALLNFVEITLALFRTGRLIG